MIIKKTNKWIAAIFAVLMMTASSQVFAGKNDDKTVQKAREAVEQASPDDWHTLAKSAEKCFRKNVNLKEASKWLDKSIEIKPTVYNLGLKGDYYAMNKLPEKALEYYIKAMNVAKEADNYADVSDLQLKISDITNIGG